MSEMKWWLKSVTIDDIVFRKKKNPYTKQEEEYTVIKVTLVDKYDTFKLAHTRFKQRKPISLICFREEIFKRLVAEEVFSFEGTVNFAYGNTYHVIKRVYDSLGFNIETEESHYFAFSSPKPHCTACKYYETCSASWQGKDEWACDGFVPFDAEEE